jgi:hypothetical protein
MGGEESAAITTVDRRSGLRCDSKYSSAALPCAPRHRQKNQFSFLKLNLVGRAELWITSVVLRIQGRRRREIATHRFTEEDKP